MDQAPKRPFKGYWQPSSRMLALRRFGASLFGVAESEIMGPSRKRRIGLVRQALALVYRRRWPNMSYPQIAIMVGRAAHQTIIHAERAAQARETQDHEYAELIAQLENVDLGENGVVAIPPPRPGIPACAGLLDLIPLSEIEAPKPHRMFADEEKRPRLRGDQIAVRSDQARASRAAYEAAMLAAERQKYGETRQTRARPLSDQVA